MKVPASRAKDVKKWQIYAINGYIAFAFVAYTEEENIDGLSAKDVADVIDAYVAGFEDAEKLLEEARFKNGGDL